MVNLEYVKHVLNLPLSDEEMRNIASPELEVFIHTSFKFLQLGTFLGSIFGPLTHMYKSRKSKSKYTTVFHALKQTSRKSAMLFFLIGSPLSIYILQNSTKEKNFKRAYGLRMHITQSNVDRGALLGGTTGLLLANLSSAKMIHGGFYGFALGTLGGILYNQTL
mmetsp:Transcript_19271/g.21832  ORF Transcript_19271/g.21832 Transcript_19271/m.21832 type:complete len:164 (+) Transcript_19271:538-1029(+)